MNGEDLKKVFIGIRPKQLKRNLKCQKKENI